MQSIKKLAQRGSISLPSKHDRKDDKQHDPSAPRLDSLDTNLASVTARPIVHSPEWQVRYDPTLSVYYYLNTKSGISQFDHPDEVMVSPLSSPTTRPVEVKPLEIPSDHRKSTFGASLKRTLSPKFFQTTGNRRSRQNSSLSTGGNIQTTKDDEAQDSRSSVNDVRDVNNTGTERRSSISLDEDEDEDIEEFKRMLELEMKSYESERLQN